MMTTHFKRTFIVLSFICLFLVRYKYKDTSLLYGINKSRSEDGLEKASRSILGSRSRHFIERKTQVDLEGLLSETERYRSRERKDYGSYSGNWRAGYDRVVNDFYGSTWNFFGWWRVQSWNGGSISPIANYTTEMMHYPGIAVSSSSASIKSKVYTTLFDNRDLQFQLKVLNAGKDCTGQQNTNTNGCVVAIHEGASCDTVQTIGPPFFDPSNIEWTNGDPFATAKYVSDSKGLSNSVVNMYNGGNGYGKVDNDQRVIVIYDFQGDGILCGVMEINNPLLTNPPMSPTYQPKTTAPTMTRPVTSAPTKQPRTPPLITGAPVVIPQPVSQPPFSSSPITGTQKPATQEPIAPAVITPQPVLVSQPPISPRPVIVTNPPSAPMITPYPSIAPQPLPLVTPQPFAPTRYPNVFPQPFPSPIIVPTLYPILYPRPLVVPTIGPRVPTIGPSSPSPSPSPHPSRKPSKTPSQRRLPSAPSPSAPRKPSIELPVLKPAQLVGPTLPVANTPSKKPSRKPSRKPSKKPSKKPNKRPSTKPSRKPSKRPSKKPSVKQPKRV